MATLGALLVVGAISLPLLASAASLSDASPRTTPPIGKELAELEATGAIGSAAFGSSVAISGDTLVVGAHFEASYAGRAYVFTETGGVWKQAAELKGSDTVANDYFGYSVAISGTTAVVGASGHAKNAGAVYVFTETGDVWKQTSEFQGSQTVKLDSFGESVAISGTTLVVGAGNDGNGRVYVFTKSGNTWKQVVELKGSDTAEYDGFGSSVALSGTTLVVGAYGAHSAGRAYVFTKSGSTWKQTDELKASDTAAEDFGRSVAISGTTIAVGAPNTSDAAGRMYVFAETAGDWVQTADLKGSGIIALDYFGASVAISGTTAIGGAPPYYAKDAGPAYLFTKSGAAWKQTAELKASDGLSGGFGYSVAISGSTAVIGSPDHDNNGRRYVFEA